MATVNQIIGGSFQDSEGNTLALGYLKIRLSQDAQANGNSQVGSLYDLQINLDSSGNVPSSPEVSLWPNSALLPSGTTYTISAYTSEGQLVWGPNSQSIPTSPSPFNLGACIPNQS